MFGQPLCPYARGMSTHAPQPGYLTEDAPAAPAPDDNLLLNKTATLHVKYTDERGKLYEGDITNTILTIAQKVSVDLARATMANGVRPDAMSQRYFNLLFAICWLKVSIKAGPDWALNLADSCDEDLVGAIWEQVSRHEDCFFGRKSGSPQS